MKTFRRLYLAIDIPKYLQKTIMDWENPWKEKIPANWLTGENLHITLLPPWEEENVENILERFTNLSLSIKPFKIHFTDITYGAHPDTPKVIWVKGETPKEIGELKNKLLKHFPESKEKQSIFIPHITLARFSKIDYESFKVKEIHEKVHWNMKVSSIVIMETLPQNIPGKYKILARKTL